ncbi:MAG TPA: WG repeat-containing protein [Pyrinomonadaceae bacterium]
MQRLFTPLLLLLAVTLFVGGAAARVQKPEPRKLFPVEGVGGGTSFIDRTGRVVIAPDGIDFTDVVKDGQYRLPMPPSWRDADGDGDYPGRRRRARIEDFSEGLASFSIDTRPGSHRVRLAYGFVDETGRVVIAPTFNRAPGDFHDGRALVKGEDGRRGYIDRTGKTVVAPVYKFAWPFSEGLALVSPDGESYGFIDPDGGVRIPLRFVGGGHFSEGLARVWVGDYQAAYIDRAGRVLFRLSEGDHGGEFREGLAMLRVGGRDGKCGFIDRAGRTVIPVEFDDARDFSEGKALVKRGDSWGFIDRSGRFVIPPIYAYGSSFSEGLAAVAVAREGTEAGWGYIDHAGNVRIPLEYDHAAPFSGGLAAVDRTMDGLSLGVDAYIDQQGRVVWEKPPRGW